VGFTNATMSVLKSRIFLLIILPATLLLGLSLFSPLMADVVGVVVNIFAPGRSHSRVFLFFLFLLLLSVITLFRNNGSWQKIAYLRYLLIGSIGTGLLLNFFSFWIFICSYGFRLSDFIITVHNSELSTSQFFHNHVLKGIVAIVTNWYESGIYYNLDTGTAYLGLLPTWFFMVGFAVILTALFSVFAYFLSQVSLWKKERVSENHKIFFILAYGIATFVLVKSIPDGGLFDYTTLPGVIALLLLIFPGNKRLYRTIGWISFLYVSFLAMFFSLQNFDTSQNISYPLKVLCVGLFILTPCYFVLVTRRRVFSRIVAVVFFLATAYSVFFSLSIFSYRAEPIEEEGAIFATYQKISDPFYKPAGKIGDLNFYFIQPDFPITVGKVIDQFGLQDNFYPVAVPWRTCAPFNDALQYDFILRTLEPINLSSFSMVSLKNFDFVAKKQEVFMYAVGISFNPCFPQSLSIIQEFIKDQGVHTFFISNVKTSHYIYDVLD
jgi:hypothetical protein